MAITLAIPYHARPDLLHCTLRSVIEQSVANWCCIVCDDSTDGSGAAPVRALSDSRIIYLRNPRPAGMVGNWNFAVRQAQTDWLTLVHADDELMPGYVDLMERLQRDYPEAALLYCRAQVIGAHGKPVVSFPDYVKGWLDRSAGAHHVLAGEMGAASLLRGCFIMCPTVCYRRQVLLAHPFSARWKQVQDLELYLRLLQEGHHFVGTFMQAYRYRRHDNNATAQQTNDLSRFHEEIQLYRELSRQLAELGWRQAADVALAMRIIKLHLGYRLVAACCGGQLRAAAKHARLLCTLLRSSGSSPSCPSRGAFYEKAA